MIKILLFVAFGGALGAVGRYLTIAGVGVVTGLAFPFGTLVVNAVGSFILGALVETMALVWSPSPDMRAMLLVGVLGAYTTFSTFSLDIVLQLERGHFWGAALYILSSVSLCVLGLYGGMRLMRVVLT